MAGEQEKKTIVITGASSGIGAELARRYGLRGHRVALLARRRDRLEEVAKIVNEAGGEALTIECDVLSTDSVHAAVKSVEEKWKTIDVAIANAGVAKPVEMKRFVLADAELVMKTNVFGMFYLFDAVLPGMLARKRGHLAGVASLAGLRGMPGFAVYSASKAAMQNFMESARVELASSGIAVTTINPGFIATEMTAKNPFKMPFLLNVEQAGAIIERGLDRRARRIQFPLPASLFMKTVRWMPDALFDRVMERAPRKVKS